MITGTTSFLMWKLKSKTPKVTPLQKIKRNIYKEQCMCYILLLIFHYRYSRPQKDSNSFDLPDPNSLETEE